MLWFMCAMIQSEPAMQQENDQHAEGKRHDVVDVVGAGRDVEEEDEVNAHLRDRENDQCDGNARLPRPAWCAR